MKKLIENFISHHRASYFGGTEDIYRYQLGTFARHFAGKEPEQITTLDMATWIHHLLRIEKLRGVTVKARVILLTQFFDFLVSQKLIPSNPLRSRDIPKVKAEKADRVPFTHAEYLRVAAEAQDAGKYAGWWVSAIHIGWHAGLRVSDVSLLEWDKCVDFSNELLRVWPKKKASVEEKLVIPMDPDLFNHLLALYNNRGDEQSPYVLPQMQWQYFGCRREVDRMFRKICDAVGLYSHSFHSFRHGFVSRLLNSSVDAIIISSMTGQTIDQIQDYAHISVAAKIAALNKSKPEAPPVRGVAVSEF